MVAVQKLPFPLGLGFQTQLGPNWPSTIVWLPTHLWCRSLKHRYLCANHQSENSKLLTLTLITAADESRGLSEMCYWHIFSWMPKIEKILIDIWAPPTIHVTKYLHDNTHLTLWRRTCRKSVQLQTIWRWEHQMYQWMDAYRVVWGQQVLRNRWKCLAAQSTNCTGVTLLALLTSNHQFVPQLTKT